MYHKIILIFKYVQQLLMKQQKDKSQNSTNPQKEPQQPKIDIQSYNAMVMRKRILDKELQNIKTMSYHELIDKKRTKEPIVPPSPTKNYVRQQFENAIRAAGFQDNVEEIAERQMKALDDIEKLNITKRREMREAPIWSQIKRGKMGIDGVLILFGIFGSILLPMIFYQKFKKNKEIIVKSRPYPPEVIENMTIDSDIDIDQVSEQSIHYDNPDRRRKFNEQMSRAQKLSALKNELDL